MQALGATISPAAPLAAAAAAAPRRAGAARRHRSIRCAAEPPRASPLEAAAAALRGALLGAAAAALVAAPAAAPPPAGATNLLASDPVKNAKALLRYSLPINNKNPVRRVQAELEAISEDLRIPGTKKLQDVAKRVRACQSLLDREGAKIAADFAPRSRAAGDAALASLKAGLPELAALVEAKDKEAVPAKQQELLSYVGAAEEAMVAGFPFEVPAKYAGLPQLLGRATVDVAVKFAEPRDDGARGGVMRVVADGYNAPLSAGDFVDLARRGFYDGMEVQRADGFVVQTGKPDGDADGFVEGGKVRRVPFEVMVAGDKLPVYEETLEDNGRFNEAPALPFNAFGTAALARGEFEPNSASSQVFFLLKESELTPTGANLLDGRYAVFGYITEGADLLKELRVGDRIVSAKVVDGLANLKEGTGAAPDLA